MLMVQRTPRPPPRLTGLPLPGFPHHAIPPGTLYRIPSTRFLYTPSVIPPGHRHTPLHTPRAEAQAAVIARDGANPRLQHTAAVITTTRSVPRIGAPHAQTVPQQRLGAGPLEQHAQLAQERRVPAVRVALDEAVRLLEREQVQHQIAQRRRVSDSAVEDARVAGREHRVCAVREVSDQIYDGVAQALHAEAVCEGVEVEECVVRWFPVFEGGWDGGCV